MEGTGVEEHDGGPTENSSTATAASNELSVDAMNRDDSPTLMGHRGDDKVLQRLGRTSSELLEAKEKAQERQRELDEQQAKAERERRDAELLRETTKKTAKVAQVLGEDRADRALKSRFGVDEDELQSAKREAEVARKEAVERQMAQERERMDRELMCTADARDSKAMKILGGRADCKLKQKFGLDDDQLREAKWEAEGARVECIEHSIATDRDQRDNALMRKNRDSKAMKILGAEDMKLARTLGLTGEGLERAKEEAAIANREVVERTLEAYRMAIDVQLRTSADSRQKAAKMLGMNDSRDAKLKRMLGLDDEALQSAKGDACAVKLAADINDIEAERRARSMLEAANNRSSEKALRVLGESYITSKVQRVLGMTVEQYLDALEEVIEARAGGFEAADAEEDGGTAMREGNADSA